MKARIKAISKKKGITYVEVMMALLFAGISLTSIMSLVIMGMNLRKDSVDLQKAISLAVIEMDKLKSKDKALSESGEYEAFPGFKYSYEIKEEEVDLFAVAEEGGKLDELMPQDEKTEEREDSETGGIITVLHYQVTINYGDNKEYVLDYYKGNLPGK
ncbi:MAG: hypothetical protein OEZ13_09015 [Spirochaetia bacterium]|nr:hypothetical protein [Spirochaetia bacterium]